MNNGDSPALKTVYKHICFKKTTQHKKTSEWNCLNHSQGALLGSVVWHAPWRQYCFFTDAYDETVFSASCLKDIADFMAALRTHELAMLKEGE